MILSQNWLTATRRYHPTSIAQLAGLLLCGCSAWRANVPDRAAESPIHADPPPVWEEADRIQLVTYNVRDMMFLTDNRRQRMRRIGELLAERNPDVVCLQEGFVRGDIEYLRAELAAIGVIHARDYPSMAVGSGLWVLSRFPIQETYFHAYTQNGRWHELSQGDWWAGKGVALARLQLPDGRLLDIYNTHMIASYGADAAAHREDRLAQAEELVAFVRAATPRTVPALLLGDLNCGPGTEPFELIVHQLAASPIAVAEWRVDHILALQADHTYHFTAAAPATSMPGEYQDGEVSRSLSDHAAILVEVVITP